MKEERFTIDSIIQIVLSVLAIALIIFLFSIIRFMFKYFRSGERFRKKNIKPSAIDKMLFYERNPFAWRIGFAYALLGYSQKQIDDFNNALYKVITAESKIFMKSRFGRFKYIVRTVIQGKSSFSLIERYKDALTSHSVLNEIDPKESLDYILFLEVDRFLNSTLQKIRREQSDFQPERPPF